LAISIHVVMVFLSFQDNAVIDPSFQGVIYVPMRLSLHVEVTKLSFQLWNSTLHPSPKFLLHARHYIYPYECTQNLRPTIILL